MHKIKNYYGLDLKFGDNNQLDHDNLLKSSGFCDGSLFSVVKLCGKDAQSYLNGQTSHKVSELVSGSGHASSYNTPKGKTIALIDIFRLNNDYYIVLASHAADLLIETMDMYLFAEDVQLEKLDTQGGLLILGHDECSLKIDELGVSHKSEFLIASVNEGLVFGGQFGKVPYLLLTDISLTSNEHFMSLEDLDALRITNLFPLPGLEFGEDKILTPELDQPNRIHYQKGCFVGQEVFARLRTYGRTNKTLAAISIGNLESDIENLQGSPVMIEGKSKGNVLSVVRSGDNVLLTAFVPTALKIVGDEVEVESFVGKIIA